jgi:hypothetical protein
MKKEKIEYEQQAMRERQRAARERLAKSAISCVNFETRPIVCDKEDAGVYIVGNTEHIWYKIGQSQTVTQRVVDYRPLPFMIDFVRIFVCHPAQCRAIEARAHALVRDRQIRANGSYSEWYSLSPEDLQEVATLVEVLVYEIKWQ